MNYTPAALLRSLSQIPVASHQARRSSVVLIRDDAVPLPGAIDRPRGTIEEGHPVSIAHDAPQPLKHLRPAGKAMVFAPFILR